jgi:site-specific DNA recombinase
LTRAALYARYSSDRQNENSVADQVALCTKHAKAKGWEVVRIFSDAAISGSAMANRPGLNDALAAAERGEFEILLTEDEDRLARNLEHMAHVANRLADADVELWTIGSGKVETMHVAFKGAMAQDYIKNLSAKTKRGMNANAEKGLATGSRLYGYRSEPGGALAIVEAEVQVIRRIFADYVAGDTPRQIAAALNVEAVPSPRGGQWNASSINGSRQRGNGVLNTELYAGVKVWGRMDVRKDRQTGKRRPRMLPPDQWKRTPVPHLRIVDEETWAAAQARKGKYEGAPRTAKRYPGIFSGLLKCGVCGGTYTVYTTGKLICATYREKGACSNRRTPSRAAVEQRALESLRDKILSAEAVASYVRTYRAAAAARKRAQADRRAPLERRLGELRRALERAADAQLRGMLSAAGEEKMMEMERERIAIEAELAMDVTQVQAEPVELHPGAAEAYAKMVEELQATLSEFAAGETRNQRLLIDSVRGLIDKIVISPVTQDRHGPIDIVLHGTLARFMDGAEPSENARLGQVVAGGGCILTQPTVHAMARARL